MPNTEDITCCECGESADYLMTYGSIVYKCTDCETIICEDCLASLQNDSEDSYTESDTENCPECGAELIEITDEDLNRISFEEMFG